MAVPFLKTNLQFSAKTVKFKTLNKPKKFQTKFKHFRFVFFNFIFAKTLLSSGCSTMPRVWSGRGGKMKTAGSQRGWGMERDKMFLRKFNKWGEKDIRM